MVAMKAMKSMGAMKAMKGMKRAASPAAGASAAKKSKGSEAKQAAISKAIMKAETEGLTKDVKSMLSQGLAESLGVPQDLRHPFQVKVVGWVAEILNATGVALAQELEAAEKKFAEADGEKAKREATEAEAKAVLTAKAEATHHAKKAAAEATGAAATGEIKALKKALAEANAATEEGDAELERHVAQKARLEAALNDEFSVAKEGSGDVVIAASEALVKLGKQLKFEPSMLTSLPAVLLKAPDQRGSFDTLVLENVETALKKEIATVNEVLAVAEPAKAARHAKVAEAAAALETGEAASATRKESTKEAVKAASAEQRSAQEGLNVAEASVTAFGPELKALVKGVKEAQEELAHHEKGALAYFKDLEAAVSPKLAAERAAAKKAEEDAAAEVAAAAAAAAAEAEAAAAAAAAAQAAPTLG
jgi:SWI/SNF-related matrix-associated actin-dependent regulator 1 of chromatin subfamily A